MWYKNKVEVPGETIYEIITKEDDEGFGLALAVISKSEPHYHNDTLEQYTLLDGKLLVHIGRHQIMLEKPLYTVIIPKGKVHWAEACPKGSSAKVQVITSPAWTPEDHHKVGKKDGS